MQKILPNPESKEALKTENRRQRNMLIIGVAMFVMSGIIVGGGTYLQHLRSAHQFLHDDSTIPDMKPAMQQARLERASELRDQWETWAREHRADLVAMRRGDRAAYSRVIAAAPLVPQLFKYERNTTGGKGNSMPFSVSIINPGLLKGGESKQKIDLINEAIQFREGNFSKFHDLPVFQSMNSGSKTIRVWVSGRITEQQVVENPDRSTGKRAFVLREREVTPAYNFES